MIIKYKGHDFYKKYKNVYYCINCLIVADRTAHKENGLFFDFFVRCGSFWPDKIEILSCDEVIIKNIID